MSLHPQSIPPLPHLTREVAHQAFPQGNPDLTLRDELGTFYHDKDFAELYATEGQPALHPWRLILVCVMQLEDREIGKVRDTSDCF